jgi:hypothetical protein
VAVVGGKAHAETPASHTYYYADPVPGLTRAVSRPVRDAATVSVSRSPAPLARRSPRVR